MTLDEWLQAREPWLKAIDDAFRDDDAVAYNRARATFDAWLADNPPPSAPRRVAPLAVPCVDGRVMYVHAAAGGGGGGGVRAVDVTIAPDGTTWLPPGGGGDTPADDEQKPR